LVTNELKVAQRASPPKSELNRTDGIGRLEILVQVGADGDGCAKLAVEHTLEEIGWGQRASEDRARDFMSGRSG
jgi:hypothetical protein